VNQRSGETNCLRRERAEIAGKRRDIIGEILNTLIGFCRHTMDTTGIGSRVSAAGLFEAADEKRAGRRDTREAQFDQSQVPGLDQIS